MLLHLILFTVAMFVRSATAECTMNDDVCEFWLEVHQMMSMMAGKVAVFASNGKLYRFDVKNISTAEPIDPNLVVVADGWETRRIVYSVNGSMPGPAIEVYEGQTIVIHVKNRMSSSALTIHWHGVHQSGTPWMDGVAFITQCPILPASSFTYRFKAYPKGTFWYHSHIGTQLSNGVVGALIIKEKKPMPIGEHILLLQEWNHNIDAELMGMRMAYGNYENRRKMQGSNSLDGARFSMFLFHSGLINGRGRFYYSDGNHTQSPLTVFEVEQNQSYRFRIIGGGSLYPFRVSVDNHSLKLLASDGFELEQLTIESLIINPGERYDVEIVANGTVDNYWIRAETLEINVRNHIAEAILRYKGAPEIEPTTQKKRCTSQDRCLVLNCPFTYYPSDEFTDCKLLGELKADRNYDTPEENNTPGHTEEANDIFFNFGFPGAAWTPGSVNGRTFVHPAVNALTQPKDIRTFCDPNKCGADKVCQCTYSVNLEHNKVYQMVFLNMGVGKGWAHPIHMHGHTFYLLKMGYPPYNKTTGRIMGDNLDIDCGGDADRDKSFCNSASWANTSWGGNNVPGLELELPPRKDTIVVPTGGYVVIRIRADNPGVWIMHCHIELHHIDGMAMILNESYPDQPHPPRGFQKCGNFESGKEFYQYKYEKKDTCTDSDADSDDGVYTEILFWVVVGCLIGVCAVLLLISACCCYGRQKSAKSAHIKTTRELSNIAAWDQTANQKATPIQHYNNGFDSRDGEF